MVATWNRKLLLIPLSVVVAGAVIGGMYWHATRALRTEPGRPKSGFVVTTPARTLVVLVDRVSFGRRGNAGTLATGTRIVTLDATTGHQVSLRVLDDDNAMCWPAAEGRIWCSERAALSLLDGTSLADITTSDELLAKTEFGTAVRGQWRADQDNVVVELLDGRGVSIDSRSLTMTVTDADGIHGATPPRFACKTRSDHRLETGYLVFGEGPRHRLFRAAVNYGNLQPPPSAPTFLRQDVQPDFLVLPDPSLLLVLSVSSLDKRVAVDLIARVDATPAVKWSAELGGPCQYAQTVGAMLVATTTSSAARARAFDLETGKILWTFRFAD